MTDIDAGADPAAEFAALMSAAAQQAGMPAEDPAEPRKAPRRSRRSPSLDELKGIPAPDAGAGAAGEPAAGDPPPPGAPAAAPDRAPDDRPKAPRRQKGAPDTAVPPYKAGVITSGVNRLYRRAGKIVRAMDADIGEAIIQAARNTAETGEPDDSVGAAWDELARTNPRIRKLAMKLVQGGAWGQLAMAHAPIALAIIMKPAILRLIPFPRLIESLAEPDDDTPEGEGGLPGGLTAADMAQMAALAEQQIARMGLSVPPEVAEQMRQAAMQMAGGAAGPGKPARSQPRRPPSRAERRKAG